LSRISRKSIQRVLRLGYFRLLPSFVTGFLKNLGAAGFIPRRPAKAEAAFPQYSSPSVVFVVIRVAVRTPVNETVGLFEVS
jgi:hypothetical protein